MPSLSIHLLAGLRLNPDAASSPVFCAGLLAPDAVSPWPKKEHAHLRDRDDRDAALRELSAKAKPGDDFALATLFHLYCDFIWDNSALKGYRESYGEGWFLPYRGETAKAGHYIFHTMPEIVGLWEKAALCKEKDFASSAYHVDGDVPELIRSNLQKHRDKPLPPSDIYTPEYVESFARYAAESFPQWREKENFSLFFPFA